MKLALDCRGNDRCRLPSPPDAKHLRAAAGSLTETPAIDADRTSPRARPWQTSRNLRGLLAQDLVYTSRVLALWFAGGRAPPFGWMVEMWLALSSRRWSQVSCTRNDVSALIMKHRAKGAALSCLLLLAIALAQSRGWLTLHRDSLCVTEGAIEKTPTDRLSVNVPKMRAYVTDWTAHWWKKP
jgi:hypothetical protein